MLLATKTYRAMNDNPVHGSNFSTRVKQGKGRSDRPKDPGKRNG